MTTSSKPIILVTNDDGIDSKGLRAMTEAVRGLGRIVVVAPDGPRSGQSGAISADKPLFLHKVSEEADLTRYKCNGTPVDCVKLAMHELLASQPALLVSGINHGSNAAVSVLYSGTMGAAIEGCILGIPSVGFSLCSHDADADFANAVAVARSISADVLEKGLKPGILLNVNVPDVKSLAGRRVCRQAAGRWTEEFEHREGHDPKAFFLTGRFHNAEPDAADTDEWALAHGYVSIVPCRIDMTAHEALTHYTYLEQTQTNDVEGV
jgi:5'-nucleotidase